jgi:hypothetical protein
MTFCLLAGLAFKLLTEGKSVDAHAHQGQNSQIQPWFVNSEKIAELSKLSCSSFDRRPKCREKRKRERTVHANVLQ